MGTTVLFPPRLDAPKRMGDKLETKFINGEFMMLCSVLNKKIMVSIRSRSFFAFSMLAHAIPARFRAKSNVVFSSTL